MARFDSEQPWWTALGWRVYKYLPVGAEDVLKRCFHYVLPFTTVCFPILTLHGPTRSNGQPGTVIVAGDIRGVDFLIRQFFDGEPQQELLDNIPLWALSRTLKRLRTAADLTVVRIDQVAARLLFNDDYLAVPEWVGSSLAVPEDLAELLQQSHSVREDLRLVQRNNLTFKVTQMEADLEVFYETMYVPFIRKRHGSYAVVRSAHWVRRIFRQGGLLWVYRDDQPISGLIFQQQDQIIKLVVAGTINGESAPIKAGAMAALYFFSIEHGKTVSRPNPN